MSGPLSFDIYGFTSPILAAHTKEYKTISDPTMGDHLAKSGGLYDAGRSMLAKLLGVGTTRKIVPVPADGFCAYGASQAMNDYHGQQMGPRMVGFQAIGRSWLEHDEIITDLNIEGKHNAGGLPILTLKLRISCDRIIPVCTVHLLITNGPMPLTDPMSLQEAMRMVVTHEDPILLMYEFENHPQVGGDMEGRHFEAMIPTKVFFSNREKEAKIEGKNKRTRDEFIEQQAAAEKQATFKKQAAAASSSS